MTVARWSLVFLTLLSASARGLLALAVAAAFVVSVWTILALLSEPQRPD